MLLTFFLKKTLNNRRRLLTLLSGLILTLSLFVGISLYVSRTSDIVLEEIYDDEGRIDLTINTGLIDPLESVDYFRSSINQNEYPTFEQVVGFYSWQHTAINWDWQINASGVLTTGPNQPLTPCISFDNTFYDFFKSMITMKEGEWNTTAIPNGAPDNSTLYNVVVSETFLNKPMLLSSQKEVGGVFFTWNWMDVKKKPTSGGDKGGGENPNEIIKARRETNKKAYCRIAGIIDSGSTILGIESISSVLYSSGFFSSIDLRPDFFNDIVFKYGEGGYIKAFDFYNLITFDESVLNEEQPMKTVEELEYDAFNMKGYLVENNNNETYSLYLDSLTDTYHTIDYSNIEMLITEYSYWLNAALPKFLIFSSPVIFLGLYILNFTIGHTMKERSKEISSLKSRGFSNIQIWTMVVTETTVISIIGALLGVFFGELLSGVLEEALTVDIIIAKMNALLVDFPAMNFLLALGIGWILILAITFLPTARIMGLSIDVMARPETEETSAASEEKQLFYNLQLLAIGAFFIIGLPTVGISAIENSFMTALGIVVFAIFLIGGVTFMSQVARLVPYVIDQYLKGTIAQVYIIAREMKRQTKRSSAAFVVLSLTMAFGIISSGLIATSSAYYTDDARFQLASDAYVGIKDTLHRTNSGYNTFLNLQNNSLYPEVQSASITYRDDAYLLEKDEPIPDEIYISKGEYTAQHQYLNLMFIDAATFKDTAYFQSYFVNQAHRENTNLNAIKDLLEQMATNPNTTCILDAQTAKSHSLGLGDQVKFTSGFLYQETVFQGNGTLLGTLKYFPPLLDAKKEPFVIVDYSMIDYQERRFTESSFRGFGVSRPVEAIITRMNPEYKNDNKQWGEEFKTKITADISNVYGISTENLNTVQSMLSENNRDFTTLLNLARLDFYYALIVSAVGFLLVLEIKTVEKKSEIGVLKAIGFGHSETFNLILVEGLISILAASTAGLIIGVFCSQLMNFLLLPILTVPKRFVLSLDMLLTQLILGVAGALLGVIIPAYMTKRFTISELIKSE